MLIGDVSGIPDQIAAESGWFDDVPAGGPTGSLVVVCCWFDQLGGGGALTIAPNAIGSRERPPEYP